MQKKHIALIGAAFAGLTAFGGTAKADYAARGFVTTTLNLRAGPSTDFPTIARIPARSEVQIDACLRDWSWCDVSWRRNHGWVKAKYLKTSFRNRNAYVEESGRYLRIPLVSFDQNRYWDYYYRDYPFYREYRDRDRPWWDRDRDRDWNRDRDRDWDWNRDDGRDNGGWYWDGRQYRYNQ